MDYSDLEIGLIIGSITARLEEQKKISFTYGMSYDMELLDLAKQLYKEFVSSDNIQYHYFSKFVEDRLIQMQKDINIDNF